MAKGISTYYGQQYLTPVYPNILLNSDMYRWQRGVSILVDGDYTCDRFAVRAVNQLIPNSSSVLVIQDTIVPYGIGARLSAVINANQIATRLGFGQRIESRELEPYRGKLMKFSVYVQRIANLPGSSIQLAFSEAPVTNDYTSAQISDMGNTIYSDSFNSLTTLAFDRLSGDILITDSMVANGIQVGIKIINSGEATAELSGNLIRVTGFMMNQSEVLTPYQKAFSMTGIEDMALFRYFCKTYNMEDAPGTLTSNGMNYFANGTGDSLSRRPINFKNVMRRTPTVVTYSTQTSSAPNKVLADSGVIDCASRWLSNTGGSVGWATGAYNIQMHWTADAEIR